LWHLNCGLIFLPELKKQALVEAQAHMQQRHLDDAMTTSLPVLVAEHVMVSVQSSTAALKTWTYQTARRMYGAQPSEYRPMSSLNGDPEQGYAANDAIEEIPEQRSMIGKAQVLASNSVSAAVNTLFSWHKGRIFDGVSKEVGERLTDQDAFDSRLVAKFR